MRVTAEMTLKVAEALTARAMSLAEVAEMSGLKLATARRYMHSLGAIVHVEKWGPDSRGYPTVRMYRWGRKKDTPRPTPPTAAERMAKSRAARKPAFITGGRRG